jgi:hypothetical protein
MQKQLAQLAQHMPSTKPCASNDKAATGPSSTTNSTTDETPHYHDEHLNRLAVVVGNASKEAQHDPISRQTSPAWKANIVKYDKILLEIELVLDFFADIQARLQYPSSPEIASKSRCVSAPPDACCPTHVRI